MKDIFIKGETKELICIIKEEKKEILSVQREEAARDIPVGTLSDGIIEYLVENSHIYELGDGTIYVGFPQYKKAISIIFQDINMNEYNFIELEKGLKEYVKEELFYGREIQPNICVCIGYSTAA